MKKLLLILFLALCITSPAFAQFGSGPFGDVVVSGGSPIFTGDITLENGEKISNQTDGIICLETWTGGVLDEDICFDGKAAANRVDISTNTGVNSLTLPSDYAFGIGTGDIGKFIFKWETGTNDVAQIAVGVGGATQSGYIVAIEKGDLNSANREPTANWPNGATPADPTFCTASSDAATGADDVLCMWHNQTDGIISSGAGDLQFTSVNEIYNFTAADGSLGFGIRHSDAQAQLSMALYDGGGNQLVFVTGAQATDDYAHATQTNPTLFVHSDTAAGSATDEWISFTHDVSNGVIAVGSGFIDMVSADTEAVRVNGSSSIGTSLLINTTGGASADAIIGYQNNGSTSWSVGFDDDDDKYKIANGASLAINPLLEMDDNTVQMSSAEGHGGYITQIFEATSGALTGATDKIELNVPSGWRILQCELHVKTAVVDSAGDDTWSSELNDGAQVEAISAGSAAAQNTNVEHWADADTWGTLTDAETDILLTPNGGNFSSGEIEAHCIARGFDTWDNE